VAHASNPSSSNFQIPTKFQVPMSELPPRDRGKRRLEIRSLGFVGELRFGIWDSDPSLLGEHFLSPCDCAACVPICLILWLPTIPFIGTLFKHDAALTGLQLFPEFLCDIKVK